MMRPAHRPWLRMRILGAAVAGKGDPGGGIGLRQVGERVLRLVVVAHLEMKIGAARASARTHLRDLLPARHVLALINEIVLVVSVNRRIAAAVLRNDDVAVSVQMADEDHLAVIRRINWSSGRRRYINTVMHGAVAHAE